tara:strand:- start:371 stop:871 length:501 start_codon:yes stop_codon:yes gene_type:complete
MAEYDIIRVTPTLDTSAYAGQDVLFNPTAIPEAVRTNGGCSRLLAMYVIDYSDTQSVDLRFFFSEGSTDFGTINETANISDANLKANKVHAVAFSDFTAANTGGHIDNLVMTQCLSFLGSDEPPTSIGMLQAASGSSSVFVTGMVADGTPTYAADSLELIFHIQKK